MWIATYAVYGLLVVSAWLLAITAGISALIVFLLYAKGTSLGVTRSEHQACAVALFAAFALGFASIGFFQGAKAFARSHDQRLVGAIESRASDCAQLGNKQPLATPKKVVILSRQTRERSLANQQLVRRLRAWRFQPAWGVIAAGEPREQRLPSGVAKVIDVQVVALPGGEALGQFSLRLVDRAPAISLKQHIPAEEQTIVEWLNHLPIRSQGDLEATGAAALSMDRAMRELKRLDATVEMNLRGGDLVVTAVNFVGGQATDQDLDLLAAFPHIEAVRLPESPITDAGLVKLADRINLRELDIRGTRTTRAGIVELQRLNPGIQIIIADTSIEAEASR